MYLRSLASALPSQVLSQRECWESLRSHAQASGLRERSLTLLEKVLLGDSGVDQRHFALGHPEEIFRLDAQALNEAFEREAAALASEALKKALARAEIRAVDLDALCVATCTGYLCPGLSSHVAERLGLRSDAYLQDLVGLGCGAAIPLMRSADGFLHSREGRSRVATVCVEICSAAFYMDDNPGVLISLCLFGDGASAAIWDNQATSGAWRTDRFDTRHLPEAREKIRFVNVGGRLCNQLDRSVPELAARAVRELYERSAAEPDAVLSHTGGRDVIDALEQALPGVALEESREVLRRYGNMSSPSVLFALEDRMRQISDEKRLWLVAFGAGFAAHSCSLIRLP